MENVLRVLVLGDSICCGDDASSVNKGFVNVWASQYEDDHDVAVRVVNRAAPGHTSKDGLREARDVLHRRHIPDLVIIAFGVNDQALQSGRLRRGRKVSPSRYSANIHAMILLARPSDVILVAPLQSNPAWTSCSGSIAPYVDALKSLAMIEQCALADTSADWSDNLLANGINHPNDEGHALYAAAVTTVYGPVNKLVPR